MSEPVLRLSGLTKTYNAGAPNAVDVLRGMDLQVDAGEVVALVAPSGAGKSTLLHIAGLLDVASSGAQTFLGQDVGRFSERQRTRARRNEIGFIYQFHHLLPEFTALENIVLPQLAAGKGRKAAEVRAFELLATVGLTARGDHRPAALSGGEQQRVAIARAIAKNPTVLFCDEPTGALDSETGRTVLSALRDVNERLGATVMIVTHAAATAKMADRVIHFADGSIREVIRNTTKLAPEDIEW